MARRRGGGSKRRERWRPSATRLDRLLEEALVDAYGDDEQFTGVFTMLQEPVRLIGMGAGRFAHGEGQIDLFPDPARDRRRRLDATVTEIRRRHGDASIGRPGAI